MVTHAGPYEFTRDIELTEGQSVLIDASCEPDGYEHDLVRFRAGIAPLPEQDRLLAEAVAAARECDVPIVVVGATATTESEGYDRQSLALPGRQDELVAAVAAANPRTVVVVNSGMPVLMPWADQVAAIVQAWFPGQEFGHALADVLLGRVEPGGRLPVTLPRTEAGCPVGKAEPVGGVLEYTEGLLIGYRGYDRAGIEPRSRSATAWATPTGSSRRWTRRSARCTRTPTWRSPRRSATPAAGPGAHSCRPISPGRTAWTARWRTARTRGRYASWPDSARPWAEPGEPIDIRLRIPSRLFARWDDAAHRWVHPRGRYKVEVGNSSRDLRMSAAFDIE